MLLAIDQSANVSIFTTSKLHLHIVVRELQLGLEHDLEEFEGEPWVEALYLRYESALLNHPNIKHVIDKTQ